MKKMLDKGLLDLRPDPRLSGLKMKISEYADIPTEYITCLPGIDHALEQVTLTYLEPGTEILTASPLPVSMRIAAHIVGSSVVETRFEDPLSLSLEPVINHITRRTRILYLGNPSEYLGTYFTEAELVFLLA